MERDKRYFFCGIGGSGMLPLAAIVRARGAEVAGSDRALDQGRSSAKFDWLRAQGIALFPQDGSGIESADQTVVASAAVEESVPDIVAAARVGAARMTRPELLAELFNAAPLGIGVGGTSGKSTVTGMIAWILHACGRDPTVMNGAVMKNFAGDDTPFTSALVGKGDAFVTELDESDGSIAMFRPSIAVLTNVTLDHKSLDELNALFTGFLERAEAAIVNADDPEAAALAEGLAVGKLQTFSIGGVADLVAHDVVEEPLGSSCALSTKEGWAALRLAVPGRHNVSNALAALSAARACGIELDKAAAVLAEFKGLRRRFEIVGTANGVTVIDDFAHNPDKIAATLRTLHAFPGRLLIFFQPHGYGPLRTMRDELIACFVREMAEEDRLVMCDPVYYGGTTNRSVGSEAIVEGVAKGGRAATHIADREACGDWLAGMAREGDRIVVMGARDDSLTEFAEGVLAPGRRA
ncbi:MAG: UDP-N-acetylmuramate--alanine ligase [Sphingomonadaceae bacterium]|nr:UDP-N-acetylmuramate--alanine ligase [Sphingomonadaceae bacterium]